MGKRICGIDYGEVRIGIALSDESKIIASPLMTLKASKETVKDLLKELAHYDLEAIVVGMPLMMSGEKGKQANAVSAFIKALEKETDSAVIPWDERLTSVQAERLMQGGGMSRKRRTKSVDQVAATIILQSYLDSR